MGLRFPDQVNIHCFFVTTTFRGWERLGDINGLYSAMADSLNYCIRKYDAKIAAYVLMPSHVHLLLFIEGSRLGGFMRDFKKYMAQKIIPDLISKRAQGHSPRSDRGLKTLRNYSKSNHSGFWKRSYDRVGIETMEVFRIKLDYIHNNPVKAGIADRPADWKWSSAADYFTDNPGVIPIHKDWS